MRNDERGILYGAAAYLMWGLVPLYWRELDEAGAVELLAHRIVWSLLVVALILAARRGFAWIRELGRRRAGLLAVASILIALNWGTYIYGVLAGVVVETALGYFINPLITVVLGVVLLQERLRRAQWAAVGVAVIAVTVLTIDHGRPPYIALTLAVTFALYGFLKKRADVGAVESLAVESAVLFLPAVAVIAWLGARGTGSFLSEGPAHAVLVAASGIVSALPLLFFGAAAIRVPLSTLGLMQYVTPSMQFILGVAVFDEPMPASRWIGFVLIWLALAVLTADGLRQARRRALERAAESLA